MNDLILKCSKNGKGVFAGRDFRKGELIIEFNGKLFRYKQLPSPYERVEDHYVQIGKNLYMGPSGKLDDFINHSCSPNSGLRITGKRVFLVAIRRIEKDEEITWDYSTTMDEDDWEIDCNCGSRNCRGRIRDFKHLLRKIQSRYIKMGIVPEYVIENLKKTSANKARQK